MKIAIGIISLSLFVISFIGSIFGKSENSLAEECFCVAYLAIAAWCFS